MTRKVFTTKWAALRPLVLAVTLVVASPKAEAQTFTTIDVPRAFGTQAFGINDAGQIVGIFDDALGRHGFLRDVNEVFTTFDVPGATRIGALGIMGINDTGQIVGFFADSRLHGFLRDANGVFTTIEVPGAIHTQAFGINNAGQIVGDYDGHGFLRDANGAFTTIDVPNARLTFARGINDAGQIVGFFDDVLGRHNFLREVNGVFTTFDVPGVTVGVALGINDAGQIVGAYGDAFGRAHGFLRTANGVVTTINVPDASFTVAFGINDAGQIVGSFGDSLGVHGFKASLSPDADPCAPIQNLRAQVSGSSVDSGVKTSLFAKLDAACAALDRGNKTAAANQLKAFQNEVKAQRGKKIPAATADAWIAAAQSIIDHL